MFRKQPESKGKFVQRAGQNGSRGNPHRGNPGPRKENIPLSDLIAKYKSGAELEIRMRRLTWMTFTQVIKSLGSELLAKATIAQMVKDIRVSNSDDETKDARIIIYTKGKKTDDEIYSKSTIGEHFAKYSDGLAYKVALNSETPKGNDWPKPSYDTNFFRILYRLSVDLMPGWRLDISLVKQFNNKEELPHNLKLVTETTPTVSTFTTTESQMMFNQYEVEVEWVGKGNPTEEGVHEAVNKVAKLIGAEQITNNEYPRELALFAREIEDKRLNNVPSLKFALNQVVSLNRVVYNSVYPPTNYFLTEKADGFRGVLRTHFNTVVVIYNERVYKYMAGEKVTLQRVTFDCEILTTDGNAGSAPKDILVFDILRHGDNISNKVFALRVEHIGPAVDELNKVNIKDLPNVTAKKYVHITSEEPEDLKKNFDEVFTAKYDHEIDGMILSSSDGSYSKTTHYKWKPSENLTIDFVAKECPKQLLGKAPYINRPNHKLYLLFNGAKYAVFKGFGMEFLPHYRELFPKHSKNPGGRDSRDYFPVHFAPSIDPNAYLYHVPNTYKGSLDNKIVELKRNTETDNWELLKIREERQELLEAGTYFGNDIHTAEVTYSDILNPITYAELSYYKTSYFKHTKDDMYGGQTAVTSFVKSELIRRLSNSTWIMDIGSGKGQDLGRYRKQHISNGIFVDPDQTALGELAERQYSMVKFGDDKMRAYTIVADVTKPHKELLDKVKGVTETKLDAIVCNLAIHYITTTTEHIDNLAQLVTSLLKPGGSFIFTCLDGQRTFNLIEENKGQWTSEENSKLKYHIERQYSGDKLTPSGQKIKIKLPFSDELYEENLVNVDFLIKRLVKHKLVCLEYESFESKFKQFELSQKHKFDSLSADDKKYLSLYSYVIMSLK
jgi:hypothetical protein